MREYNTAALIGITVQYNYVAAHNGGPINVWILPPAVNDGNDTCNQLDCAQGWGAVFF